MPDIISKFTDKGISVVLVHVTNLVRGKNFT